MADNTTLNTGAGGDVIATDDIGGVKYQRVKVTYGPDGASSDVAVGNGLPVASSNVTVTNRSGSITTGGTAQQLMAANTLRKGFWIQNISTGDLYISDVGTATNNSSTPSSLVIKAGDLYESSFGCVSSAAISILGGTTGQKFVAREW
jgi:hypothetical protein